MDLACTTDTGGGMASVSGVLAEYGQWLWRVPVTESTPN